MYYTEEWFFLCCLRCSTIPCTTPLCNTFNNTMYHSSLQYFQQYHVPLFSAILSTVPCTTLLCNTFNSTTYHLEYCRDELLVILFKVLQRGVVLQSIQDIAERSGLWYCVFYLNVLSTNMFLKLFKIKKTKHIYDSARDYKEQ
jgi:hypothetical protein